MHKRLIEFALGYYFFNKKVVQPAPRLVTQTVEVEVQDPRLQEQLQNLQKENARLKRDAEQLGINLESLRSEKENELKSLRSEKDSKIEETRKTLSAKIREINEENASIKEELNAQLRESERLKRLHTALFTQIIFKKEGSETAVERATKYLQQLGLDKEYEVKPFSTGGTNMVWAKIVKKTV